MTDIAHSRISSARGSDTSHSGESRIFTALAQNLRDTLVAQGLAARLTVGQQSEIVGVVPTGPGSVVEFYFSDLDVFRRLMVNVRLYDFAKAYFNGDLNVLGSFRQAAEILYAINLSTDVKQGLLERGRLYAFRLAKAMLPNVARRFESDAHYSINADAYGIFLDKYFQYTCAKFNGPADTLEQAQVNKFLLIAALAKQHIGTLKGVRHLDIGCGWGGLVSYFQTNFGTHSTGVTNSAAQKRFSREQFGIEPLLGDFADLEHCRDEYDLITIVGMAEHLTPRRRSQLFEVVRRSLKDGGLVYFQCIAKPDVWIGGDAYRIAYEDVFPGHYLESSAEMEMRFREQGFDILYAADDAADYAKTTALWADNIEHNRTKLIERIGERNFRVFLGYLSYANILFERGRGSLKRYMLRKRIQR